MCKEIEKYYANREFLFNIKPVIPHLRDMNKYSLLTYTNREFSERQAGIKRVNTLGLTLGPRPAMYTQILRLPAVKERTGLSRSTLYEMMRRGDFPQPVPLGARAIGFIEAEVAAWIDGRIAAARGPHGTVGAR